MDAPLVKTFMEDDEAARAFHRFSLNFTVNVSASSDKAAPRGAMLPSKTPATMSNASMSGLCFSSLTEFTEGTEVEIEVDLGSRTHRVPAVVRRCIPERRLGRTFYECGAQYLKTEATLRFLPLMARYLLARSTERNDYSLIS